MSSSQKRHSRPRRDERLDTPPSPMSRQLFGLFDDPRVCVLTEAVSEAPIASLSDKEAAAICGVAPKRRREYATARALAREGLERFFDVRGFDLINAEDRSPIWPAGVTGSISHTNSRAWVALAPAGFGTIGIDGEDRVGLNEALWPFTLVASETAYLEALDPALRRRRALALFSAKEALFKAQYPRSGCHMGYAAVSVKLDDKGSLRCRFEQAVGPYCSGFEAPGRWLDQSPVVTAVWMTA